MAIGDENNDLEMLRMVGHPVAYGQRHENRSRKQHGITLPRVTRRVFPGSLKGSSSLEQIGPPPAHRSHG